SSFDPHPSDFGQPRVPPAEAASPVTPPAVAPPRVWGPWSTIGWTVLCIAGQFASQFVVLIMFIMVRLALNPRARFDDLATNGNLVALASLVSAPVAVGMIALLIVFRPYPIRDYLALTWPPARQVLLAGAGLVLLLAASDLTSHLLGLPIVSPWMVDVYRTASPP